ncbi:hypothetical protein IIB79_00960 [candidate division KSB1 bacterium]|nr:hypothetical protein [candidate division KSB1 bacterium]
MLSVVFFTQLKEVNIVEGEEHLRQLNSLFLVRIFSSGILAPGKICPEDSG